MTPCEDVNAPDLYIPLMAFITYVLVSGFVFGVQKRSENLLRKNVYSLFQVYTRETRNVNDKCTLLSFARKYYCFCDEICPQYFTESEHLACVSLQFLQVHRVLTIVFCIFMYIFVFRMVLCLFLFLIGGRKVYYFGLIYCTLATVFFLVNSFLFGYEQIPKISASKP